MRGIDVSHHQDPKRMDYSKIRAEGFDWLIARAAYGSKEDETFHVHVERAIDVDMVYGAYLFYRQTQDKARQLDTFQEQIDRVGGVQIAPVLDFEWNEKWDGKVNPARFNEDGEWILEQLVRIYGKAIVYLSPGFFQTLGCPSYLLEYPWWVSHWTQDPEPWCPFKAWSMWQYTNQGNVDGYAGDLDLNRTRDLPLLVEPEKPIANEKAEVFEAIASDLDHMAANFTLLAKLERGELEGE